ncbi:MAG TPA: thioesterase family protein [Gammaproteobacteria bacterium]|jgi:uncharacterized protein (TIGR00369 family)|nr:thioesterase family protein [Gammaproteobacteria bacterium]
MNHAETILEAFSKIPFNQLLGITYHPSSDEELTLRFKMQKNLIGNFLQGILHGGVISSVLDMAGGAATIFAYCKKNPAQSLAELQEELGKTSTIHLNIDYLRPGKGEEFFAKAKVLRTGNKISVTQMELTNESNVLIATGSGTYFI